MRNQDKKTEIVEALAENVFKSLPVLPKQLMFENELLHRNKLPMGRAQLLTLLSIEDRTPTELSEKLGIAKPNITKMITGLVNDGLCERMADEGDGRKTLLRITPAGREVAEGISGTLNSCISDWASRLSVSELKTMNDSIATILSMLARVNGD